MDGASVDGVSRSALNSGAKLTVHKAPSHMIWAVSIGLNDLNCVITFIPMLSYVSIRYIYFAVEGYSGKYVLIMRA